MQLLQSLICTLANVRSSRVSRAFRLETYILDSRGWVCGITKEHDSIMIPLLNWQLRPIIQAYCLDLC